MSTPDVELRLPPGGAYVVLLRTLTAGLAARLDFTLEEIEDARVCVGEAAALALEAASPDSDLHTAFDLAPGRLTMTVSVDESDGPAPLDETSFAWTLLTTLAEATCVSEDGRRSITVVATSQIGSPSPA
ncbi:MAG: anti-sigma factor [Nocardioides sp.]|uniref:anti-sigma factor n=1 Tax=Nocardioides sp. TaxID=35761 RepID=UPI0039E61992